MIKKLAALTITILLLPLLAGGAAAEVGTTAAPRVDGGQQLTALASQVGGAARALAVDGGLAFMGIGPRLHVVALSGPTPTATAAPPLAANIESLAVAGEYVYLAAGSAGLVVVSINDLQRPAIVGQYDLVDFAVGVAVAGDTLYLAGAEGVVVGVDVGDPAVPAPRFRLDELGQVTDLSLNAEFLLVARGFGGLDAYLLGEGPLPRLSGHSDGPALSLATAASHVFVGSDFMGGVALLTLDHAGRLTPVGSAPTSSLVNDAVGLEAAAHPYAALALAGGGWSLLDIADPNAPTMLLDLPLSGPATAAAVDGDTLFLLDEGSGLYWYDMGEPTRPVPAGSFQLPGVVGGVAAAADGGVLLDGTGLYLLDADGGQLGHVALPGTLKDVVVAGTTAYVAGGAAGLHVVDLASGAAPRLAATIDAGGDVLALAQGSGRLYAGVRGGVLVAFRLTEPAAPQLSNTLQLPGSIHDLALDGDLLAVADWQGVQLVDLAAEAGPRPAGRLDTPGYATGVALGGGVAYVADWFGVQRVAVDDRDAPRLLSPLPGDGFAVDVALDGDVLYVAGGGAGVAVYVAAASSTPARHTGIDTPGYAAAVAPRAGGVLVADGVGGFFDFDVVTRFQIFLPLAVGS